VLRVNRGAACAAVLRTHGCATCEVRPESRDGTGRTTGQLVTTQSQRCITFVFHGRLDAAWRTHVIEAPAALQSSTVQTAVHKVHAWIRHPPCADRCGTHHSAVRCCMCIVQ